MKAYIFKKGSDYEAGEIQNVYLVEESMESIEDLRMKWVEYVCSLRADSTARWTVKYILDNLLSFEEWFIKNYAFEKINFEEIDEDEYKVKTIKSALWLGKISK